MASHSQPDDVENVRVAVRIRPLNAAEQEARAQVVAFKTPDQPHLRLKERHHFTFDDVFPAFTPQPDVFDTCVKGLVDGSLEGRNATILAYGQTGSGKTYTMGTASFDVGASAESIGVLPRAARYLFDQMDQLKATARDKGLSQPEFSVQVSFVELYQSKFYDLFSSSLTKREAPVKIRDVKGEDGTTSIKITGMTQCEARTADDIVALLQRGTMERVTATNGINMHSSRSHAIFTMWVTHRREVTCDMPAEGDEGTQGPSSGEDVGADSSQPAQSKTKAVAVDIVSTTAKFNFVDLAGSERLRRTKAIGVRAQEGISINSGLLALGNVISALGDPSRRGSHVPYRDNKLTRLLQDSLGGNSKTVMIACISPADSDFMETLNTLKYANRARNIQNRVVVNQDSASREIQFLRETIQKMNLELMEYKQGRKPLNPDSEEANDLYHELNHLRDRCTGLERQVTYLKGENASLKSEAMQTALERFKDTSDETVDVKAIIAENIELRAQLESASKAQTAPMPASPVRSTFHTGGPSTPMASPSRPATVLSRLDAVRQDTTASLDLPAVSSSSAIVRTNTGEDLNAVSAQFLKDLEEQYDLGEGFLSHGLDGMSEMIGSGDRADGQVRDAARDEDGDEDGDRDGEESDGGSDSDQSVIEESAGIDDGGDAVVAFPGDDNDNDEDDQDGEEEDGDHEGEYDGQDEGDADQEDEQKHASDGSDGASSQQPGSTQSQFARSSSAPGSAAASARLRTIVQDLSYRISVQEDLLQRLEVAETELQKQRMLYEKKLMEEKQERERLNSEREKLRFQLSEIATDKSDKGNASRTQLQRQMKELQHKMQTMEKATQQQHRTEQDRQRAIQQIAVLKQSIVQAKSARKRLMEERQTEMKQHRERVREQTRKINQLRKDKTKAESEVTKYEQMLKTKDLRSQRVAEDNRRLRDELKEARAAIRNLQTDSDARRTHKPKKGASASRSASAPSPKPTSPQSVRGGGLFRRSSGRRGSVAAKQSVDRKRMLLEREVKQAVMYQSIASRIEELTVRRDVQLCEELLQYQELRDKLKQQPALSALQEESEADLAHDAAANGLDTSVSRDADDDEGSDGEAEGEVRRKASVPRVEYNGMQLSLSDVEDELERVNTEIDYVNEALSEEQSTLISMETAGHRACLDVDDLSEQGVKIIRSTSLKESHILLKTLFAALVRKELASERTRIKVKRLELESEERDVILTTLASGGMRQSNTDMLSAAALKPKKKGGDLQSRTNSGSGVFGWRKKERSDSTKSDGEESDGELSAPSTPSRHVPPSRLALDSTALSAVSDVDETQSVPSTPKGAGSSAAASSEPAEMPGTPSTPAPQLLADEGEGDRANGSEVGDAASASSPSKLPSAIRRVVSVFDKRATPHYRSKTEANQARLKSTEPTQAPTLMSSLRTTIRREKKVAKLSGLIPAASSRKHTILRHAYTAHGHTDDVLCLSATGSILLSGSKDKTFRIWDVAREAELLCAGHQTAVSCVGHIPSRFLSVSKNVVHVWDARTRALADKFTVKRDTIEFMQADSEGNYLYLVGGKMFRIWDMRQGREFKSFGFKGKIQSLCLDATQERLALGVIDKKIRMFDLRQASSGRVPYETLQPPHFDRISALAFNQAGIAYSGSDDGSIKSWEQGTDGWTSTRSMQGAYAGVGVSTLACLPLMNYVVSGSAKGSIKVWSGDRLQALEEHSDAHSRRITSVAVSDRHLFSASKDNTIKVWTFDEASASRATSSSTLGAASSSVNVRQHSGIINVDAPLEEHELSLSPPSQAGESEVGHTPRGSSTATRPSSASSSVAERLTVRTLTSSPTPLAMFNMEDETDEEMMSVAVPADGTSTRPVSPTLPASMLPSARKYEMDV
eukprot:m.263558 g.263558  ORF g.263558 m.263558 type:complete len:1877 (-) comp15603_c0_seq3:2251-7881(-)